MPDILSLQDFLLAPLFLILIYNVYKRRRDRLYKGSIISQYFLPALFLRIGGNVSAALIYQYYYNSGDTFVYYDAITMIWNGFLQNPLIGWELIFNSPTELSWDALNFKHFYLNYANTGWVIRIGGFLSLFTLNTYLCIAFIITLFAFEGCWRLYTTFYEMYPQLHKELALALLFIPSVCFFGTGLQKDSIVLAAVGFMTQACYRLFIRRELSLFNLGIGGISLYLIFIIKPYILMAFLPALVIWIFWKYRSSIPIPALRALSAPLFVVGIVGVGYYLLLLIGQYYKYFSLEYILEYSAMVQASMIHETAVSSGTGYSLGQIDTSPLGLLSMAPRAIGVSLFRPYLWEATNPLLFLAALEALGSTLLTVFVLWKVGVIKTLRTLILNPEVAFALTFAIVFSFAVGFSTYNFGALMRYKMPAFPFYFAALAIIYGTHKRGSPSPKNQTVPGTFS